MYLYWSTVLLLIIARRLMTAEVTHPAADTVRGTYGRPTPTDREVRGHEVSSSLSAASSDCRVTASVCSRIRFTEKQRERF